MLVFSSSFFRKRKKQHNPLLQLPKYLRYFYVGCIPTLVYITLSFLYLQLGHRRSCSDGSSGEIPNLGWQHHGGGVGMQSGAPWGGRSYTHLPMVPPYQEEAGYQIPPLPPHIQQHPDYPCKSLQQSTM